ncbi:hypothetical protein PV325_013999 [Microctonus aethiopoides]|uniref:Uncharacterized protein n=1 Tax=Microctonus aethiopoides TaxID=144406 RepID=A0AA39FQ15_9HYME|nr:hypothetical protein PV325_013999 [Microctonus aethiopoides]KAK0097676.1 hypothetical protein PV326_000278 [Microctonus aethiopoides]KAK0173730.1 hypothetical protein PV328_006881 [Microctonus aethiopoides]
MINKFSLILVVCTSVALAIPAGTKSTKEARKPREHGYYPAYDDAALDNGYALLSNINLDSHSAPSHPSSHHGYKTGFSVGGGLVAIARGAADQARSQVASQHSAAGQAAYVAKNTLAQSAAQSAATAAAALAGKQIILSGLEQQSRDAHVAVDGEKMQLQQAQRAATAARNSAQQAMHQLQVVTAAMNAAQATSDHAAQAAAEAAAELAAQTTMVGQAKARAQTIDEQLKAARIDFAATQSASDKAAAAAQLAQNNAAAAAAHAADSAAVSGALPSVADEEDGHHAAAIAVENHEPLHNVYLPAEDAHQLADDHEQTYVLHRNTLPVTASGYASHQDAVGHDEIYDYKGYF